MVKAIDPPLVPTPAPALISPVGCSFTVIFIILEFLDDPGKTSLFTSENIFLDFKLAIDLLSFKRLKGSPSSRSNEDLTTDSFVTVLPLMFIFSTNYFVPS